MMQPIFFGSSARPLYGVVESAATRTRRTGVLLFYPGVHEYMRAHWAFRALAGALAARGFAVLRFDYRGTGDSAGGPDSTTLEACVEDACLAADELRDASTVERVALLGMRFGAAVAMHTCERVAFASRVFAWNPVVDGRAYLRALEEMDAAMRLGALHPPRPPRGELAGFSLPPHVRRSLEGIDLCGSGAPRTRGVEIFAPQGSPEGAALRESLAHRGLEAAVHTIRDGDPAPFPDATLLARDAITTLTARMDAAEP